MPGKSATLACPRSSMSVALALAGLLAGCQQPLPPPPVVVNDGYFHTAQSGSLVCDGRPISLDGSHSDITLTGPCRVIRVNGSHVDMTAYIPPGARIELNGSSIDVVWRLTRPGAPPQLINNGQSNNFYRNSRLSAYQTHDWYQEQR